jgi:hypothetical protein
MWHPWNFVSSLRRPVRILDRLTSEHHKYIDLAIAKVSNNPIFFPEGFFCDGWGDVDIPKRLQQRLDADDKCAIRAILDMKLTRKEESTRLRRKFTPNKANHIVLTGQFQTTLQDYSLLLPRESHRVHFEMVVPSGHLLQHGNGNRRLINTNALDGRGRALVILLPGTGDHGCQHRRTTIAEPLAASGVSTIILEGPFYGQRKPKTQKGSKLRR